MKTYLFPKENSFYKTNLHCHTTISDGVLTPEEVKRVYVEMGYHAICFTDHDVLVGHKDLTDESLIALHGVEVSNVTKACDLAPLRQSVYHFNLIAESPDNLTFPTWPNDLTSSSDTAMDKINGMIQAANDAGFLVNYNHPQWSLQTLEDYTPLEGLFGIEVINGGARAWNDNTSIHMEVMLRRGKDLLPMAGDDNHYPHECGRCFTMISAKELSYEGLIDGLRSGNCYASEAPEILELSLENGRFLLRTDRPCRVVLLSEGRHMRECDFTTAADLEFKPSSAGRYVRFELRDEAGNRAFTRAYDTAALIAAEAEGKECL